MRARREGALADLAREVRTTGVSAEMAENFRNFIRTNVRELIVGVMREEVEQLCGPRHRPAPGTEHFRSGSAPGYVLYEGRRMDLDRPRVRRQTDSGTAETLLASYVNAQEPGELQERVLEAFKVGVSGRDQERLHGENTPGVSKSEVSRLWRREGEKMLVAFRARDIARPDWLVLMLDGVRLDKDLMAVIALGVAEDGTKHLLDFEIGASETTETAKGLLERLSRRGFAPAEGCRLLAVLDGSAALKSAVLSYWPDTVVQRCLVHKERNVKRFLRKKDWKELARHFDRLRKAQGLSAGEEALRALERFVGERNKAALESLREAGDELLALHRLEVPATLNVSFLSTNLIESPFQHMRKNLERVCRWDAATDMPSRWLAYGLTESERGFRRIRFFGDLKELRQRLAKPRARTVGPEPADVSCGVGPVAV
jgi:transposase-like protein